MILNLSWAITTLWKIFIKNQTPKQHKHLVYVYSEINNLQLPEIPELVRKKFCNLLWAVAYHKATLLSLHV